MKIIKRIIVLILILIVLGALYLATLDGNFNVERSRTINAQPEVLYNEVIDYKNWQDWGPWYESDSTIVPTYDSITSGIGASYSWTDKEGGGSMTTTNVDEPNRIDQQITFNTPMGDMVSNIYWQFENQNQQTKVTWGMEGELGFFYRMAASKMEEQVGPMLERGLVLLDSVIQVKMEKYSIKQEGVVAYSGGYYLYTTTSCKIADINSKFQPMLQHVAGFIHDHKIRGNGAPFSLYHKFDQDKGTTMFSVCYPISEKVSIPDGSNVLVDFLDTGFYMKTILKGSYKNSEEAWNNAYAEVNTSINFVVDAKREPFEIYINNLHDTPNPADLVTEIYIPVKKVEPIN